MKPALCLLLILLLSVWCSAQPTSIFDEIKTKFPDQPAAYIDRSQVLTLRVDGDSLNAFVDVTEDLIHLRENTESVVSNRVYGSHFSDIKNLDARTLVWNKSKYNEVAVAGYKKNNDSDRGIFYDDSYYYSFDYPAVASKNRTQLKYREILRDPRFVSGFMFSSYLPQARTSYTIKTSKDVEIYFEVLNDTERKVIFNKKEKGNSVTYEWSMTDVQPYKVQDNSPPLRYYAPHLIVYVKSFKTRSSKMEVLPNLDALYKWYWSFIDGKNSETGSDLEGVVRKIKSESSSPEDLVRRTFYWVQDNIQYVAFEQGMRGLIPNSGTYTCEKRYGDCKDMANLIVNMLQLSGLQAYHGWIGTRDLPYRYTQMPTPLVDNHMIAVYVSTAGEYFYLDGTSQYTPLGFPSSMIQGKEILIAKGPKTYEIRVVPVVDMSRSVMIDSMNVTIRSNQLVGSGKVDLGGYTKIFGDYELDKPNPEEVKRKVTKIVGKGSNKFLVDKYTIRDNLDRDKHTVIEYDFQMSDYFQRAGSDIYINLNLSKDYHSGPINLATRNSPIDTEYKYTKIDYTELKIPEGYEVNYLPENSTNKGKYLGFTMEYATRGDKIVVVKTLFVDYLLIDRDGFQAWNNDLQKLNEVYKERVILRKAK